MDSFVALIKPFLLRIATSKAVKDLVIALLEKYVTTTDNSIDNMVLTTVKELMFKPQV